MVHSKQRGRGLTAPSAPSESPRRALGGLKEPPGGVGDAGAVPCGGCWGAGPRRSRAGASWWAGRNAGDASIWITVLLYSAFRRPSRRQASSAGEGQTGRGWAVRAAKSEYLLRHHTKTKQACLVTHSAFLHSRQRAQERERRVRSVLFSLLPGSCFLPSFLALLGSVTQLAYYFDAQLTHKERRRRRGDRRTVDDVAPSSLQTALTRILPSLSSWSRSRSRRTASKRSACPNGPQVCDETAQAHGGGGEERPFLDGRRERKKKEEKKAGRKDAKEEAKAKRFKGGGGRSRSRRAGSPTTTSQTGKPGERASGRAGERARTNLTSSSLPFFSLLSIQLHYAI